MKHLLLMTAALVCCYAASAQAAAGSATDLSPASAVPGRVNANAPAAVHHEKYAVLNYQTNGETVVNAGLTSLDSPTTIACAAAAGCTITTVAEAQVLATANHPWGLCFLVDGNPMRSGSCPYLGILPSAITAGTATDSTQVAKGNHTVQTQIYFQTDVSTVYWWQSVYTVYSP